MKAYQVKFESSGIRQAMARCRDLRRLSLQQAYEMSHKGCAALSACLSPVVYLRRRVCRFTHIFSERAQQQHAMLIRQTF